MYCGLSPVSDDSGKRKGFHRTTHRANKVVKDAIIQIAESNRRYCASSTAYYNKKREAGLSHWQAVKCLARRFNELPLLFNRGATFFLKPVQFYLQLTNLAIEFSHELVVV